MSPILGFLILFLTAFVIAYLTKQFQKDIIFSNNIQMKNINAISKKVQKEKVFAETIKGRFAMISLIAATGVHLTTGQIIPGLV